MTLAPPPVPDAHVEEGPVGPWLGASASTGALVGFLVGAFEAGSWLPQGSIWSWGAGRPRFPTDLALRAAAIALPARLVVRLVGWFVLARPPATNATRDRTICLASALGLGGSVAIVATDACASLAVDWSGAPADARTIGASLFFGVACAALGVRAWLLGSERHAAWLIELDLFVLTIAASLASFWAVFTAASNAS